MPKRKVLVHWKPDGSVRTSCGKQNAHMLVNTSDPLICTCKSCLTVAIRQTRMLLQRLEEQRSGPQAPLFH